MGQDQLHLLDDSTPTGNRRGPSADLPLILRGQMTDVLVEINNSGLSGIGQN